MAMTSTYVKLLGRFAKSCVILLDKVPANLILREVGGGGRAGGVWGLGGRRGSRVGVRDQVVILVVEIAVGGHGCGSLVRSSTGRFW